MRCIYLMPSRNISLLKRAASQGEWWEKVLQTNRNRKQINISVLHRYPIKISGKNKEALFILVKGTTHHEDIITILIYPLNTGIHNFTKQTLLDIKLLWINPNTLVLCDFSTPLSVIDPLCSLNREALELSDTIDQINLADTYSVSIQVLQNTYHSHQSVECLLK